MTPDKRLDQLEPLIADIAQKQDRMLDLMGLIVDKTAKVDGIEDKANIIANGVAHLTTAINQQFTQVNTDLTFLKDGQTRLESSLESIQVTQQLILDLIQNRLK